MSSEISKIIFISCLAAVFFILELLLPLRKFKSSNAYFHHDLVNLVHWLLNFAIIIFSTYLIYKFISIKNLQKFGLMNLFMMPYWLEVGISFILLDLWMYLWHRLSHEVYIFWRFHRFHHTDKNMNYTTLQRYHLLETVYTVILRVPVLILLGIRADHFLIYEFVMYTIAAFHHSNIRLSSRIDLRLNFLVVTPLMHRIHHQVNFKDSNSNYAAVFSFWDRIFNSFISKDINNNLKFGQNRFLSPFWNTPAGIIKLPFVKKEIVKKGKKFIRIKRNNK